MCPFVQMYNVRHYIMVISKLKQVLLLGLADAHLMMCMYMYEQVIHGISI